MSIGNDPAVPCTDPTGNMYGGMTKREHLAGIMMQGLISSWGQHDVTDYTELAYDAVMAANALLAVLEDTD